MTVISDLDRLRNMVTYPGMDPIESRFLRAFIRRYGDLSDEFRFNVRVGPGEAAPEGVDDSVRRAIEEGTRARLDCVAWKAPNFALLIEAKDEWTNAAVWQLLGYRDLYHADNPEHVLRLVGVAGAATTSARTLAQRQGITLFVYTFPEGPVDIAAQATESATDGL